MNASEDEEQVPSSADFEQHFFSEAQIVTLEIKILKETYEEILKVIQRNGWEIEEGLRILLTLGSGYAQGRYFLEAEDEQQHRLAERLADLESVAAVMKFRAFTFMRDNQVLEMRSAALQNSVTGLEAVVQRLRLECEDLRAELERLRSEAARPTFGGTVVPTTSSISEASKSSSNCLLRFVGSLVRALRGDQPRA